MHFYNDYDNNSNYNTNNNNEDYSFYNNSYTDLCAIQEDYILAETLNTSKEANQEKSENTEVSSI